MALNGKNAENYVEHSDSDSSPWQKVLAIRVTTVISKIEEISEELRAWTWTGKFEIENNQPYEQLTEQIFLPALRNQTDILDLLIKPESLSLSYSQVALYQCRLETMSDEIKGLDIDGIENEILHLIRSSRTGLVNDDLLNSFSQKWLNEMFATAVDSLVQELPRIASFRVGLSKWSARLSVFCEAFNFIRKYNNSVRALNFALSGQLSTIMLLSEVTSLDRRINQVIAESSKHLDLMLDMLVGNEDRLPEKWMKKFEIVEEVYIQFKQNLYLLYARPDSNFQPLKNFQHSKECDSVTVTRVSELADENRTVRNEFPEHENTQTVQNLCKISETTKSIHNAEQSASCVNHSVTDRKNKFTKFFCTSEGLIRNKKLKDPGITDEGTNDCKNMMIPFLKYSAASQSSILDDAQNQALDQSTAGIERVRRVSKQADDNPNQLLLDLNNNSVCPYIFASSPVITNTCQSTPEIALQIDSESSSPLNENSPCIQCASRRRISRTPAPPLHSILPKRRKKENLPATCQSQYLTSDGENAITCKELSVQERISEHINEILKSLPSDTQLKGNDTTDSSNETATIRTKCPRSSSACVKTPYKKPITINAASSTTRSCKSENLNANQDIKVYHLTQTDREQPTKLFVRLVGEHGERVMVRVGGGWADLGAYLRQHAGVYARRAVSDSKFEVRNEPTRRTLDTISRSSPLVSAILNECPSSRGEICFPAKTCGGMRPTSSKSNSSKCRQALHMSASQTSHMREGKIGSGKTVSRSQGESSPTTPTIPSPVVSDQRSSPLGIWPSDEIGLAGSESRRRELLDEERHLAEKNDGKARNVSMSIAELPIFGDLGLVGKTKRVWPKRHVDEATA